MRCGACGTDNREGARFCDACGRPLADREPDTPSRKVVTVLFADLSGSTKLQEQMDPESARAVMAPFFTAMRDEVERHGGTVAKFRGDGLLAVFGVPDVREDDAVRALQTGLGLHDAIARLNEVRFPDRGLTLAIRVGINTGEIVVAEGDADYVGDVLNVGARLESLAPLGEVLVGEDTWRLTRDQAVYESVPPLVVRGKSEPINAHRLMALLPVSAEPTSSTFVGRTAELDRLLRLFSLAVDTKVARLVTVIGAPGLGKTRLTNELSSSLGRRALVLTSRCNAAASATFAPVGDALRIAAGAGSSATPEDIEQDLASLFPASDPDGERIASRTASLLGAGVPGSTAETFWAVRRVVERVASNRPVVWVFEDLQWAEPKLLDLVEHVGEWVRDAPVLIVATGRPELRDVRPSLTEHDVIALEGLADSETERLVSAFLETDDLPASLSARLPEATGGNPLFARELVRMLVDDGTLRQTDGSWEVTSAEFEVPPTIQLLLAARVDRLQSAERSVLELASVVGNEFYLGAIAALAPSEPRETLDAHLKGLVRTELIEPADASWIDEPMYCFHHALIRDAAYRRLLKESRAELHELAADWFDQRTVGLVDDHDELVGYHLEQAHHSLAELGPLNEHGLLLGRRAAALLGSAAQAALDRDDLHAAASLSRRALRTIAIDDPNRSEYLLLRCESLLGLGEVDDGAAELRVFTAAAQGSPRLEAWAACFDGELANLTDPTRLRGVDTQVAAAAADLAELGDLAGAAKAHTVHAMTLTALGRVAESEAALDDALVAAREKNDRRRMTAVLGFGPVAALWGPSPVSRAGGRCLDILRLSRITTNSPVVEATSERCQAVLEALRGRTEAGRKMLARARSRVEELGLDNALLETELYAGIVELIAAEPEAAEKHLRKAHEGFRAIGVGVAAAQAAALLARTYLALGREDDADVFATESELLGGDDLQTSIWSMAARAEILARTGRIDAARDVAERAVAQGSSTDALIHFGYACTALAAVCRTAGDDDGAHAADALARSAYERKGAVALAGRIDAPPMPTPTGREGPAKPPPENTCTRVSRVFAMAFMDQLWDEIEELLSPNTVFEDFRPGLKSQIAGRDAVLAVLRGVADIGGAMVEWTPVRVRGERFALISGAVRGTGAGAFEAQVLQIQELDEQDRIKATIILDPDDLEAAYAELDARAAAGDS